MAKRQEGMRKYLYALLAGLLCVGGFYGYNYLYDRAWRAGVQESILYVKSICVSGVQLDAGQYVIVCKRKVPRPSI